jgi:DNA-binding protein YbaB
MVFESVKIDPSLLDDVTMVEDLLLAALHDAVEKVNALNAEATGDLGELMG